MIYFNKRLELFPTLTCARAKCNLSSICLGVNILSSVSFFGVNNEMSDWLEKVVWDALLELLKS